MTEPAKEYLIASAERDVSDQILAQAKQHIEQDPDASVLKERSELLVAAMSAAAVDRLQAAFEHKLIIEPNSELKY